MDAATDKTEPAQPSKAHAVGIWSRFGDWLAWLLPKSARKRQAIAVRLIVSLFVALAMSETLTMFEGTTLMFPKSWRDIVVGLGTILGVLFFEIGKNTRERLHVEVEKHNAHKIHKTDIAHKPHEKDRDVEAAYERVTNTLFNWYVRLSYVVLLLLVCCFFAVRSKCVYHFDPTNWLATQVMADAYHAQPLQTTATSRMAGELLSNPADERAKASAPEHSAGPGTEQSTEQSTGQSAGRSTEHTPEQGGAHPSFVESLVPDFINKEQKLICLPMILSHDDQAYIDHVSKIRSGDGIRIILDEQPGLIINWLTGAGPERQGLEYTTMLFMCLYLLVVAAAMFLLGLRFDPFEILWGRVFGLG